MDDQSQPQVPLTPVDGQAPSDTSAPAMPVDESTPPTPGV